MSTNSSIVSGFQLLNYKVDNFQIKNKPRLDCILKVLKPEDDDKWNISVAIMQPTFYKKNLNCLGGFKIEMFLPDMSIEENNRNKDNSIISLECNIVGLFKVVDNDDFEKQQSNYEDLIKYQMPALLLPFLRATITSFFASAGYGSFIFPLINVFQMAQEKEITIKYIE